MIQDQQGRLVRTAPPSPSRVLTRQWKHLKQLTQQVLWVTRTWLLVTFMCGRERLGPTSAPSKVRKASKAKPVPKGWLGLLVILARAVRKDLQVRKDRRESKGSQVR